MWRANRRQVPDPAMITAGEPLRLPGSPQVPPWLARAAIAAPPAPAPPVSAGPAAPAVPAQAFSPPPASPAGVTWAAIAACESSGNGSASTGNGCYGGTGLDATAGTLRPLGCPLLQVVDMRATPVKYFSLVFVCISTRAPAWVRQSMDRIPRLSLRRPVPYLDRKSDLYCAARVPSAYHRPP